MTRTLVDTIEQYKQINRISDAEFIKKLGLNPSTWYLIKTGKREPGVKFLKALLNAYPDLLRDVVRFIADPPGESDAELKARIDKAFDLPQTANVSAPTSKQTGGKLTDSPPERTRTKPRRVKPL